MVGHQTNLSNQIGLSLSSDKGNTVGFVAAAVSMSTGGCRVRRPGGDVSLVSAETVGVIVAAEPAVL